MELTARKLETRPRLDRANMPAGLLRNLLIAGTIVIFGSAAEIAYSARVLETSLTSAAADEGASLADLFVSPLVQELATATKLPKDSSDKLDDLLKSRFDQRKNGLEIWLRDGTLAYSTRKNPTSEKPPAGRIDAALLGKATGKLNIPNDDERQTRFEVVAPVYRTDTKDVIAAAAIYSDGERLVAELSSARIAWIAIVAAMTAPMIFGLFLVRRYIAKLDTHGETSDIAVREASALAVQNEELQREVHATRIETEQSDERLLGRIGQDLHDGPISDARHFRIEVERADRRQRSVDARRFAIHIQRK